MPNLIYPYYQVSERGRKDGNSCKMVGVGKKKKCWNGVVGRI